MSETLRMSYAIRISHSFPPTYQKNNQYLAQVHSIIKKFNIEIDPKQVYFRPFKIEELAEIRLLHEEWFPVEYSDDFYNKSIRNGIVKTLLAVYDFTYEGDTYPLILGCLTYDYKFLDNDIARFSFSDLCGNKYGIYILTFGVINEVRSKGIGTALLAKIFEIAESDQTIKYIYLDVIAYNDQGIKCYERNGFIKIDRKKNHYKLFGERYDAIVYCRYVNDGKRPRSVTELVCCCVTLCGIPQKAFDKARNVIYKLTKKHTKGLKYKPIQA